jgi:uncharacterized protein YbdZ (MbtH family)
MGCSILSDEGAIMSLTDAGVKEIIAHRVIVNQEGEYAVWAANREVPPGWRDVGKGGSKSECVAYIREVWSKTRPSGGEGQVSRSSSESEEELVHYLSQGRHPVESSLRAERSARALKQRIDLGHVHIKFTATRGQTELGVALDREATVLTQADFERQTGDVHLEGELTLNDVRVRCVADIDLRTLTGLGHLVPVGIDRAIRS